MDGDTIAAISTPIGEGALGVIRLSGPDAIAIADKIFTSKNKKPVREQKAFTAQVGHVIFQKDSKNPKVIDEVLLLVMRAPKSATCEDVVELSAHGGLATLQAVLECAIRAGARIAEKGEFTKRAFLNGRMDLLQAEAVLDLVSAQTELGRAWAAAQLDGVLSNKMKGFKNELLDILTQVEASIDFPDDFLEPDSFFKIEKRLSAVMASIRNMLSGSEIGLIVKKGLKVVIVGLPNVGKSSLMNCLVKENRVIVTAYPGTTRDTVEEAIQIQGFPIRLVDTAGIQDCTHPIEREGIERSKLAVAAADLVLYVVDGSQAFCAADRELLEGLSDRKKIIVINKSDLPQRLRPQDFQEWAKGAAVQASCVLESGVKVLEENIVSFMSSGQIPASDEGVVSSLRQKDLLEKVYQSLSDASAACRENRSPELLAVDIRLALDHLGMLVGEVVTDDILECLFSQFCIGK